MSGLYGVFEYPQKNMWEVLVKVIKASLFVPLDFDHGAIKCLCRLGV